MTDRELLALAAKAAGIDGVYTEENRMIREFCFQKYTYIKTKSGEWNPLTDDGDNRMLQIKLRIDLAFDKLNCVSAWCAPLDEWLTEYSDDGMGADIEDKTKLVIVRVAAEMGKCA